MSDPAKPRFAKWKFCPRCNSYRFTWTERTGDGECQDCGAVVVNRVLIEEGTES